MKYMRFLSMAIAVIMLLTSASFAEELGEMDLYAPEIYIGECEVEAPMEEVTTPEETAVEATVTEPTIPEETAVEATAAEATGTEATGTQTTGTQTTGTQTTGTETTTTEPTTTEPAASPEPKAEVRTVALTDRKATAQMNVGEALQIAVNAGETGAFATKNAKYATVDANGLVTALAKGKAKIEFKPTGGKKRTLTIRINDPYEPAGVSIAQGTSITLNVGDALQLGATLSPETARTVLTWKCSKAKVATVDANGVVTALKEGKAKITVTTANKKKATIAVLVADPNKPLGVSIAQGGAATMNVGDALQLDAVLAPETARTVLTWKSSKAKVATVDANGVVTALKAGKAKITVTTANKKKATIMVQVVGAGNVPPRSPAMNTGTYNGVEFKVVNTAVDPFTYAQLVYDKICTHPDTYSGYCLGFCNYYASCMVDNVTDVDVAVATQKYRTSKKLRYSTEKYGNPDAMMARLYDLVSAGVPQILMVEAITHPGSRHFVVVVGYRASVARREDLRPEDLLVIDSFDGKLESMDPTIEPTNARVLFKQKGKYRIEALTYKS